jgi:hypothetical protein
MIPSQKDYVVHGLDQGQALCTIRGIPREWPIGNLWVPLSDHTKINCPGCLKALIKRRSIGGRR